MSFRLANRVKTVKVASAGGYLKIVGATPNSCHRILAYHLTGAGTAIFQSSVDAGTTKVDMTGALACPVALAGGSPETPLVSAPKSTELGVTLSGATQGFITYVSSEAS